MGGWWKWVFVGVVWFWLVGSFFFCHWFICVVDQLKPCLVYSCCGGVGCFLFFVGGGALDAFLPLIDCVFHDAGFGSLHFGDI